MIHYTLRLGRLKELYVSVFFLGGGGGGDTNPVRGGCVCRPCMYCVCTPVAHMCTAVLALHVSVVHMCVYNGEHLTYVSVCERCAPVLHTLCASRTHVQCSHVELCDNVCECMHLK